MGFELVTVRGEFDYPDKGNATGGTITFTLDNVMRDPANNIVVVPKPMVAQINNLGIFSIQLVASDSPGTLPQGTPYTVEESVTGSTPRRYRIIVPYSAQAAGLDIADVQEDATPTAVLAPYLNGNNTFTGQNIFQPNAVGVVPLIARGTVGQTANLQGWRDSNNTILAAITADGSFVTGGGGAPLGRSTIYAAAPGTIGEVIRGAISQTADSLQVQNSSGAVIAAINAFGSVIAGGGSAIGRLTTYTGQAGALGSVIVGASGQTADLFQAMSSTAVVQAAIGPTGQLRTSRIGDLASAGPYADLGPSSLIVNPRSASQVPLISRGFAAQSANLEEWQDSAGSVLAGINSQGYGLFPQIYHPSSTGPFLTMSAAGAAFQSRAVGQIPLDIYGTTGQTASLQRWRSAAGSDLAYITNAGRIMGPSGVYASNAGTNLNALFVQSAAGVGQASAVIMAAASQAAHMVELKDSANTLLSYVDNVGRIFAKGLRLDGSDAAGNVIYNVNVANTQPTWLSERGIRFMTNQGNTLAGGYPVVVRPAATGQTANLQEWQNDAGGITALVNATGAIAAGGAVLARLTAHTLDAGTPGLVIRGAASQTADLLQIMNSANSVLWMIDSAGRPRWNANTQTTVGLTGAASGLPALPVMYLRVQGPTNQNLVVPAYNA